MQILTNGNSLFHMALVAVSLRILEMFRWRRTFSVVFCILNGSIVLENEGDNLASSTELIREIDHLIADVSGASVLPQSESDD